MAKIRSDKKRQKNGASKLKPELAPALLEQGTALLQSGQPDEALKFAKKALTCLTLPGVSQSSKSPALELLGEIYVELGDPDEARNIFQQAAKLDPDAALPEGAGGGADKFLWLAQLCEEGGQESIEWFDKGCTALRREINEQEVLAKTDEEHEVVEMKKQKLANALCGAAEVYMTDLSWEEDAEARCEALVTEACLVASESPEPLQTLASVRISQQKFDDARSALNRSLEMWSDLPPEDPDIPDFPTRVSLARLLMETELEAKALDVLERLVAEDDSSVEAWYLGGWCLHLLGEKQHKKDGTEKYEKTLKASRDWLLRSLKLYKLLDYEDDRLKDHAVELVQEMSKVLGPPPAEDAAADDDDDDDDEDGWEDEDEDERDDEEMADT